MSIKQDTQYFDFRCKIQLDHPVYALCFHLQHDDGGRDEPRVSAVAAEVEPVADGLQSAGAVLVGRGAGVRLQGV